MSNTSFINDKTPNSLLIGWTIGQRIVKYRKRQQDVPVKPEEPPQIDSEPIAYLYNDLRAPELPKEAKNSSYIVITVYKATGTLFRSKATCYAFESYEYTKTSDNQHAILTDNTLYWSCEIDDETLTATGEWEQFFPTPDSSYIGVYDGCFTEWANFDLLNENGTIFMKASDPVPVYE